MRLHRVSMCLVVLFAGGVCAQEIELQAQLSAPLGTDTNRKGDLISAVVLNPAAFQGDVLEGRITDSQSGAKIRGRAVLSFTFETLRHGGQPVPISAQVKSVTNSKGQVDVDEEGRVIRKTSNVGKAVGGTAVGGLIGGLAGGVRGAAIGAGVGAAASIVLIQVAADGPSVRFAAGSTVVVSAKSRSGPALASLAANPAPAAPAPAAAPAATAYPPAPSAAQPVAAQPAAPAVAAPQAAPAAPAASAQPDLTAVKADFIPGEKTIFFDDFSDMAGDEPPPHWKVRGGSVVLKVAPGIRQMTTSAAVTMTPNFTGLPKNFTMEAEVKFDNPADSRAIWEFFTKNGAESLFLWTQTQTGALFVRVNAKDQGEEFGQKSVPVDFNQPIRLALWVQNGRLRLYVNGERAIDVNQVNLPELWSVAAITQLYGDEKPAIGYRAVRFAESTPDFSQMISSSGRYVTHGILFDTDSDRIKPESAPVIKSIARGLETNPNLKLLIQGHTDSIGNADHNLDLSKRRAEAVKAVLVSQFSVDAARLTTAGLGSTKPIDSNDTPQGRAQNRRVEFARQ